MKFVVYGLGISGISTAKFLASQQKFEVIATDDNAETVAKAKVSGATVCSLNDINFDQNTIISFSPGIPLHHPTKHKILEICQKTSAQLACDIEIFYRLNWQNNHFIAITGTNGKSTTTALAGFIFDELKIPAKIGGNIGVACFDLPQNQSNFSYIFETSSYQLDLISKAHFAVAALLNITPDHIDRHGSMAEYIKAKKRIFLNQKSGDFALVDVDNSNSKQVFDELSCDKNFAANLIAISTQKICERGVSLLENRLHCKINGANFELNLESQFLRGEHNRQNMAFAFAITYCHAQKNNLKISPQEIVDAISKFKGLRHRMQIVKEVKNIRFINDSKATNAESTQNALKAYENIFWIVGGKAKEGGISSLKPYFNKIVKAYLIGEATEDFAKTLGENSVKFEKCQNLKNAFALALKDAKKSELASKNIILLPACASFDQWKNFEQRGDYFCELVDEVF